MTGDLTYRVGGRKSAAPISDGLDPFGYGLDLIFQEGGLDLLELLLTLLLELPSHL